MSPSAKTPEHYGTNRIEAFSDGVFAIVVTLLVLEFHVPEISGPHVSEELYQGLIQLIPKFLCYVMSFIYVAIYWVNHHQLFHIVKHSNRHFFWFNNLFLMWMTIIPFPTALIGSYPKEPAAIMVYGAVMFFAGVSFVVMKWYAVKARLLEHPDLEANLLRRSRLKIFLGPVLYLVAILVAETNYQISLAIYIMLPVFYFFPQKVEA